MRKYPLSVFCVAAALAIGALPCFAQSSDERFVNDIDAKQKQACTPDVQRLCNNYVPDIPQIVACLKREKANLSPACGEVFSTPEQCKAEVQSLCKDYLVVIPGVMACLKRALDRATLNQDCANAVAALLTPAPDKKPPKKTTKKTKK